MRALVRDDLVIGKISGDFGDGIPLPDALSDVPASRLRFDGTKVLDAGGVNQFFIDAGGVKHVTKADGRQALTCALDAPIVFVNGAWSPKDTGALFAEVKAKLADRVDAIAEAVRLQFVTPGAGQAMVYRAKQEEALAFKAAASPIAVDFPLLSASVGIEGATIGDVADKVLATAKAWTAIAAQIETARLKAKNDLKSATDEPSANAIVAAINWPSA